MMQYGDEIGMGDDLRAARARMRADADAVDSEPHGGFSRRAAHRAAGDRRPVYGYEKVNVAEQRRDPQSLLNWTERMIRMRKECPEISWGDFSVLRTNVPEVLAIRYDWRGTSMLTLHNFSNQNRSCGCASAAERDELLVEVFDGQHSRAPRRRHAPHHARALTPGAGTACGAPDNVLDRSDLSGGRHDAPTARDPGKS